jgi:hypothetical protein
MGGFGRPSTSKDANMNREHFDAILNDIEARHGNVDQLRISMRNSEVYHGTLAFVPGAEDVLTLTEGSRVVYIALPAIATVSEYRR